MTDLGLPFIVTRRTVISMQPLLQSWRMVVCLPRTCSEAVLWLQLAPRCVNGTIGMLPSTRSGDLNVAMIFMRQEHVTSRSKSITVNFIARTNLLKRNLKPSVVL